MRIADVSGPALAKVFESLDWADINELCAASITGGVFGEGFYAKCVKSHAKVVIRRLLKSGRLRDAAGEIIKVASIVMTGKDTKKARRVYKREDLFTEGDFVQVMNYHRGAAAMHRRKFRYYKKKAIARFGPSIQGLLPGFDEEDH